MDERPQTDDVGPRSFSSSVEFCQAVLDDIEFVFRRQYGTKWSPETQQLFYEQRRVCLLVAEQLDGKPHPQQPLRAPVILTNGTRR